ncbi:RING-type domain-containing protein [Forsythia ovata]|uniref:RING-type domain-containing protein n=1 Tax=Forsythia ovata TaxID=205694 RepID=A0ABD1VES4_9LAMI
MMQFSNSFHGPDGEYSHMIATICHLWSFMSQNELTMLLDGSIPVSFIQKYLKRKLDLTSEDEVEIKCMGQSVVPTLTLNNLVDIWLQTTTSERVSATIGSSAKDFVMVLGYTRKVDP